MSGIPNIPFDLARVWTEAEYEAAGPRTLEDRPEMGQILVDSKMGKEYMFVENVDATAQSVGSVVCCSFARGLIYDVDQLGGASTGIDHMAGVCMGAIPAAGGRGWIQTWGENTSIFTAGATDTVLGDSLKAVSGQKHVVKDAAIATEPTYARHIRCLEAYTDTADALKKGFILCK